MKKLVLILVIAAVFVAACSRKEKPEQKVITREARNMDSLALPKIEIKTFMDTLSGDAERVAAGFLKASLLDGDYRSAIEYLCEKNRTAIAADTLMDYIIFGKNNPGWDSLTALKIDLTRRYIPVLASLNELREFEKISCNDICRIKYTVAGPLLINKMFEAALGPGGKRQFDTLVDSNLSLREKSEYYDRAFKRISLVADSMDMIRRAITDTLTLIQEGSEWRVCKNAQTGFEIFKQ